MLTLLSVLVATITAEVRLSAKSVVNLTESQVDMVKIHSALAVAKMELMLELMPKPAVELGASSLPISRFNGRVVATHYPTPGMVVRIFSHAGKINLRTIDRHKLGYILAATNPGGGAFQIESALDSWEDWIDADDLLRLNGAEKKYYMGLDPPYAPRNEQIATVEEVRLIKGFNGFFVGTPLKHMFTVYGKDSRVNLNLATAETMSLLPGLDAQSIEAIVDQREIEVIDSLSDLTMILSPEQLQSVSGWLQYGGSEYYTIVVYPETGLKKGSEGQNIFGYAEIVKTMGTQKIPQTVCVMPSYPIPASVLTREKKKRGRPTGAAKQLRLI